MKWEDEGIILSARPHGETSAIVDALTRNHGRHAGLVRGGQGRRMSGTLQPGTCCRLTWNARLAEHLGAYRVEPIRSDWVLLREDGDALFALASAIALISAYLPEREPCPEMFAATSGLIDTLSDSRRWHGAYIGWELALLDSLGYGPAVLHDSGDKRAASLARRLADPRPLETGELAKAMGLAEAWFRAGIARATDRPLPGARTRFRMRLLRTARL